MTFLPSTPLLTFGAIFFISSWSVLMCSTASCHALELVLALHRVGAGARHGGADVDGVALRAGRPGADRRDRRPHTAGMQNADGSMRAAGKAGAGLQQGPARNGDGFLWRDIIDFLRLIEILSRLDLFVEFASRHAACFIDTEKFDWVSKSVPMKWHCRA